MTGMLDTNYDRRFVGAVTPPAEGLDLTFGELQVAEYVVFLLSLDVYHRYLEESFGSDHEDDVSRKGLHLLRIADNLHLERIEQFLLGQLPQPGQRQMLSKALRLRPTADGASRRALMLRTVLSRGGTATMKAVFDSQKARSLVKTAIASAMLEDADQALDKLAVIPMHNTKLRDWIDEASATAGSGVPQNPVAVVAQTGVSEDSTALLQQRVREQGSSATSEEAGVAVVRQQDLLSSIEKGARETARKTMEVGGEQDLPQTKSEVVGIATAVAASVLSDPTLLQNIPSSLRGLDPEQQAAAMTDGRVLVAAGAGSGKTTTLVARISYLIRDRGVSPSKIFAVSFNTKAAKEIRERLVQMVGQESLDEATVGTMHSTFKKFVCEYGTPEEKSALTTWLISAPKRKEQAGLPKRAPSPGALAGYMSRIWKEIHGEDPPRGAQNTIQGWMMNDITPEQAKATASGPREVAIAEWYRWTQGFKGVDKSFEPPGVSANPKAAKAWGEFLSKWRDNGRARLGDFTDMILMFRNLLKRDPKVRAKVQSMFDHVCVDEAQDLNKVQHDIVAMMSEHVSDGADGKSVWLVGDELQSINHFVGARPELFAQFAGKPGWKLRSIATNYRCLPEIVEAANRLMQQHPKLIPMEARPDSKKPRGSASIVFQTPNLHSTGAINTVNQIQQDLDAGSSITDYAVLSRTNMELNDYETACIISGVPYARRGGSSFLRSPETLTVLAYFNLAVGSNYESMQKSLIEAIQKPQRFFFRTGEAEQVVREVIRVKARRLGVSDAQVNPLEMFDNDGIRAFLDAMDPDRRWENWRVQAARTQLEDLGRSLHGIRSTVEAGKTVDRDGKEKPYTTQDLFGDILNMKGVGDRGKPPPTLRDQLMPQRGGPEEESDAPVDDDEGAKKPIGNVQFLFHIAQATGGEDDPAKPANFKRRMDQLYAASKELRVDLDEWDSNQQALAPDQRQKPPCVILSTVHCSPPDEPVLTTSGWVEIGKLDPTQHKLASYQDTCNQLLWGIKGMGYPFIVGSRHYEGPLLTLVTEASRARITPDHRVRVKYADNFFNKYVVYLMRRGDWWRVGICVSGHRPYRAGGVAGRLATEKADSGWILQVCATREEALIAEATIQGRYGIPGLTFQSAKARSLSDAQLHAIHDATSAGVSERVLQLFQDYGLDVSSPLYPRLEKKLNMRDAFLTEARNLLPLRGYLLFPAVSEGFIQRSTSLEIRRKPMWLEGEVTTEHYDGVVFSLTVMPHRYYVSGGQVVHNSVKGAQWPNTTVVMAKGLFPFEPRRHPEEDALPPEVQERIEKEREREFLTERQLAYVAMTRASKSLTIISPGENAYGRAAGTSVFVQEAGLHPGQNVAGKNDPTPDTPSGKTVFAHFATQAAEMEEYDEPTYAYDRRA